MCELFAASTLMPTTVSQSLEALAEQGGLTGPHKDGWGVAFYDQHDIQLMREPAAASRSAYLRFIREQNFISHLVIAHVRLATQGPINLKKTQPFGRELGGRMHVFAHNGDLKDIKLSRQIKLGRYLPIGDTDSEYAFCCLMNVLQNIWRSGEPPQATKLAVVSEFAQMIRPLGPDNFLYSDGEILYAHGHKRTQKSGGIQPPGLFWLSRTCLLERAPIEKETCDRHPKAQQVILVASVPLTHEQWVPFAEGEILYQFVY
ncbi:MAG: class II glutamine amidotransferase [Thermosynechococcaceae cyanobacterium]